MYNHSYGSELNWGVNEISFSYEYERMAPRLDLSSRERPKVIWKWPTAICCHMTP